MTTDRDYSRFPGLRWRSPFWGGDVPEMRLKLRLALRTWVYRAAQAICSAVVVLGAFVALHRSGRYPVAAAALLVEGGVPGVNPGKSKQIQVMKRTSWLAGLGWAGPGARS